MKAKLYELGAGGMVEIDTSANDNLPVGTLLQWNGYDYDKCVITSRHKSDFDGSAFYEYINIDGATFGRIEAWGLKPIAEKKDDRIAVYILPEVMDPAELLALYEKAKALKEMAEKKAEAAAEARRQAVERGRKIASEKIPADSKAVIVAVHDVDACDIQTDYFHHTTSQLVVLAASKNTRDMFPEMRKAAAKFPQTAHMGPGKGRFSVYAVADKDVISGGSALAWKGSPSHWHDEIKKEFDTLAAAEEYTKTAPAPTPIEFQGCGLVSFKIHEEEIEHREKWSMGEGYYLKDGHSHSTGWKVYKYRKGRDGWAEDIYLSLGQLCIL